MYKNTPISQILVCPICKEFLTKIQEKLRCKKCNSTFYTNKYGFINFITNLKIRLTLPDWYKKYAKIQEISGKILYNEYFKLYQHQEKSKRILDVGCGIGKLVSEAIKDGYDAYGIDLPYMSRLWFHMGNNPKKFFLCDALQLPFPDDFFDTIYSIGLIEHIGVNSAKCWEIRQQFANELLRVSKFNGTIVIFCPNKHFPIDIQHPVKKINRLRYFIYKKTNINLHPIWGNYHLLSYSETKKLFCDRGGARYFNILPIKNFLNLNRIDNNEFAPFLKPFLKLLKIYINYTGKFFRSTFLNPLMLAQIRK